MAEARSDAPAPTRPDGGMLGSRIIEAGGDRGAETLTLEEYNRMDVARTLALYNESYGPLADLRDEA